RIGQCLETLWQKRLAGDRGIVENLLEDLRQDERSLSSLRIDRGANQRAVALELLVPFFSNARLERAGSNAAQHSALRLNALVFVPATVAVALNKAINEVGLGRD